MNSNRPLWAPWRIEFIRSEKDDKCFLCGNEADAPHSPEDELIIKRGKYNFIIANRFPYNSGHLLVAPYRHVADIAELSKEERYEMMDMCVEAKEILQKVMSPEAFNVGFNLGASAGAGLEDHLHMHVVPRWAGDTNFMPVIANTRCVPEALLETVKIIREALS